MYLKSYDNNSYIPNSTLTIDASGKIISRVPTPNPTVPGASSGVRGNPSHSANGIGYQQVSIIWNPPTNSGNLPIIDYMIRYKISGGSDWTDIPDPVPPGYTGPKVLRPTKDATYATIYGLVNQTYSFAVTPVNARGPGLLYEDSPLATFVPIANSYVSPTNFMANRSDDSTSINLSWETPSSGPSQSQILGYKLEESIDRGITWQNFNSTDDYILSNTLSIPDIITDKDYYYRISAFNIMTQTRQIYQSAYNYVYSSGIPAINEEVVDADASGIVLDPGNFNSIVSNEPVQIWIKYKNKCDARLGCVIWRFYNDQPRVADDGGVEGMARRIITFSIPFSVEKKDPQKNRRSRVAGPRTSCY
jgi:hypothetical protein